MNFFGICFLIDIVIAILVYFFYCVPKWGTSVYTVFLKTCLYCYGFCVLFFTCIIPFIFPLPFFNMEISNIHFNLIPFVDYINGNGDFMKQIELNVLMLIPFGILYPFIYKKNLVRTVLAGLLISTSIELIQLFSVRQYSSCDITDVITNVAGTLVGYLLYKCLNKPVDMLLQKIFANRQVRKYQVSVVVKKVLMGFILLQLLVRSVLVVYM